MALSRGEGAMYKLAERAVIKLSGQPIDIAIYDAKAAYAAAFDSGEIGKINQHMAAARAGFEKCLQIDPRREDCHYQLGLVHASVKASEAYDPKKALAELALAPTTALAWVETARLQRSKPVRAAAMCSLILPITGESNAAA